MVPVLGALLIGLVLGFLGSMPLAGPVAAVVARRGLERRSRDGVFVALGSALPEAVYAFLAFWGLSAMMGRFPLLLRGARLVGCLVLVAVGVYFLVRPIHSQDPNHARNQPRTEGWRSALLGFTMTAANPTLLVSWSAAVGVAHATGWLRVDARDALPFATGVASGIVAWFVVLLFLLERFRARAGAQSLNRTARIMGAALVLLGFGMGVRLLAGWI